MTKNRKLYLASVGAVLCAVAIVVAAQPSAFHIERSVTVEAPPPRVFQEVNDFRAWTRWSPYERLDPALQRTYEGAPSGAGAVYAWASDDAEVGRGRMTILESATPSRVTIRLELLAPFAATSTATFTFVPAAGGTTVTWAMDGQNSFLSKAFSLVWDVDARVGGDFETGLAAMKSVVESSTGETAAIP